MLTKNRAGGGVRTRLACLAEDVEGRQNVIVCRGHLDSLPIVAHIGHELSESRVLIAGVLDRGHRFSERS